MTTQAELVKELVDCQEKDEPAGFQLLVATVEYLVAQYPVLVMQGLALEWIYDCLSSNRTRDAEVAMAAWTALQIAFGE